MADLEITEEEAQELLIVDKVSTSRETGTRSAKS